MYLLLLDAQLGAELFFVEADNVFAVNFGNRYAHLAGFADQFLDESSVLRDVNGLEFNVVLGEELLHLGAPHSCR